VVSSSAIRVAAALEFGVPLVLGVTYWRSHTLKPKLVVLLGAVTPFLICYSLICATYPFRDVTNPWAAEPFNLAQQMSLWPYVATILVGIGLSFSPQPSHFVARYFLGLLGAPIIGLAVLSMLVRL